MQSWWWFSVGSLLRAILFTLFIAIKFYISQYISDGFLLYWQAQCSYYENVICGICVSYRPPYAVPEAYCGAFWCGFRSVFYHLSEFWTQTQPVLFCFCWNRDWAFGLGDSFVYQELAAGFNCRHSLLMTINEERWMSRAAVCLYSMRLVSHGDIKAMRSHTDIQYDTHEYNVTIWYILWNAFHDTITYITESLHLHQWNVFF